MKIIIISPGGQIFGGNSPVNEISPPDPPKL